MVYNRNILVDLLSTFSKNMKEKREKEGNRRSTINQLFIGSNPPQSRGYNKQERNFIARLQ